MRQGPPSGRPFAICVPKARSGPIVLYFAARKSICCGMEQSLSLRRARPSDLAAVDLLLSRSYPRLLAADYPPSTLVTALPLISRARPDLLSSRSYFVVEDAEGRIVGAGGWTAHSPAARGGKVQAGLGHIRHVATEPSMTRQGIGTALMGQVIADALSQGVRWLDCLSTRTAVPFYRALGFRVVNPVDISLAPGIDFPVIRMMRQIRP